MKIEMAKRIEQIPPYLFAEIDKKKEAMRKKGMDIIDLGIGDPDLPTPAPIIERLKKSSEDPKNHRYPSYEGMIEFRRAAAQWFEKRFGVKFDLQTEVLALIGSKEGIAHIPLAFVNPGDYVLVPSPGYPVYRVSTLFAGGTPYFLPLRKENGFLPNLSEIPESVAKKAKLLFINYPNNPTSAIAEKPFFEEVVAFARRHQIIVCHDAAYSEVAFDGYRPLSFFEVEGAKEIGIEFHSLSKTFNMTGWRIGFAVGCSEIISVLGRVKTNIDSGIFQAIQEAGLTPGKDVMVVGVDATKDGFAALIDGTLGADIECNPLLGPQVLDAALKGLNGDTTMPSYVPSQEGEFFAAQGAEALKALLPTRKY